MRSRLGDERVPAFWVRSIENVLDGLPYVLIGGPTVAIALAGSILLLGHLLRRQIQPNRDYPRPRLPRQPRPADPEPRVIKTDNRLLSQGDLF